MADHRKETPYFFEDEPLDPVDTATGYPNRSQGVLSEKSSAGDKDRLRNAENSAVSPALKKKAGFYLSADILERFNLKFYELKLAGAPIENKSNLLELMLAFALDDLDKGAKSYVLQTMA
jgi:hypothetical protein